jgi:hypothetical protein
MPGKRAEVKAQEVLQRLHEFEDSLKQSEELGDQVIQDKQSVAFPFETWWGTSLRCFHRLITNHTKDDRSG